jgi:hypothetical protein
MGTFTTLAFGLLLSLLPPSFPSSSPSPGANSERSGVVGAIGLAFHDFLLMLPAVNVRLFY